MKESDNQRQRRWLHGRYHSAKDMASAYLWLCDRSSGSARMGVDYERMAASLLEGGHPTGGLTDFQDMLLEIKHTIVSFLFDVIGNRKTHAIWGICRLLGNKPEKIARDYGLSATAVQRYITAGDEEIERALDRRGRL